MARIRFDFGTLTLDAELLDTPTAKAIAAALPITSSALTWGEEVYSDVPVEVKREANARTVWVMRGVPAQPVATPIKVGISDGSFIEVLEGLSEGDLVVIDSTDAPGAKKQGGGGGGRRF